MDDLDRLAATVEAMTDAPWQRAHHGTHEVEGPPGALVADCGTVGRAEDDAHGIAALRNVAPELIAVVRAARAAGYYARDGEWILRCVSCAKDDGQHLRACPMPALDAKLAEALAPRSVTEVD